MKLQEANDDLRRASQRLREAQQALDAAAREHRIAGETVEKLEQRAAHSASVSTLCAVCDQIKELHPGTHEWTAREV